MYRKGFKRFQTNGVTDPKGNLNRDKHFFHPNKTRIGVNVIGLGENRAIGLENCENESFWVRYCNNTTVHGKYGIILFERQIRFVFNKCFILSCRN